MIQIRQWFPDLMRHASIVLQLHRFLRRGILWIRLAQLFVQSLESANSLLDISFHSKQASSLPAQFPADLRDTVVNSPA